MVLAGLLLIQGSAISADRPTNWIPLLDSLNELRQQGGVPAMGVIILDEGRPVVIETYGNADPDTPFRWGSITKSFTALAAQQLVREYEVDLSTPIRSLLGEGVYINDWADTHPVRLIHLLELSAGFADLSREEFSDNEPRTLWQALERSQSQRRALWPPGLQHSYSNVPPGLTAGVIEKVSGMSFNAYLETRVFQPLDMRAASLDPVARLPGGYKADGRTPIPYWHVTFAGFGALNASLNEMANFTEALLQGGRLRDREVLPADLIDGFFTPSSTLGVRQGLTVSYASGVYGWVRGAHTFWGHGGDADGYRSRYGLLRGQRRGYVLVINTDNPALLGRMRRLTEDALVDDLPRFPESRAEREDLSVYAGRYYPTSVRFGIDAWQRGDARQATVSVVADGLEFERGSRTSRLIGLGDGRFIRPGDPDTTVVFARDSQGSLHMQGELGNFVNLSNGPCPGFIATCE